MQNFLRNSTLAFVLIFYVLGCSSVSQKENAAEQTAKPYVILISIDGYRRDYTELFLPPNLVKFRDEGSSAKGLLPVYPSKTFTNHLSIATGLYAENHGIVGNFFYDPARKEEFKLSNRKAVEDGTWFGGTPLWVAAEKQGMISATYFWPGSEAAIQNVRPTYYFNFDQTTHPEKQVAQVVEWLKLPEKNRPHFITIYFSEVDAAGHEFGTPTPEVKSAVLNVDRAIGSLLEQTKPLNLPLNVVIVSDHGMQNVEKQNVEYLDDYVDMTGLRTGDLGPAVNLYFEDKSKIDGIYKTLKAKAKHFRVFKKAEIPAHYHYQRHLRIGDIIAVADAPHLVGLRTAQTKWKIGNHGYDVDVTPSMQGIFYARGPQIQSGMRIEPFRNIHIYPLILRILSLKTLTPNDGDAKLLNPIYRN